MKEEVDIILETQKKQREEWPSFINEAMLEWEIERTDKMRKVAGDQFVSELFAGKTVFEPFRRPFE